MLHPLEQRNVKFQAKRKEKKVWVHGGYNCKKTTALAERTQATLESTSCNHAPKLQSLQTNRNKNHTIGFLHTSVPSGQKKSLMSCDQGWKMAAVKKGMHSIQSRTRANSLTSFGRNNAAHFAGKPWQPWQGRETGDYFIWWYTRFNHLEHPEHRSVNELVINYR